MAGDAAHNLRQIAAVEEQALNAWPALRDLLYDGWQLRFADGHTRLANSVQPLYSGASNTRLKVELCEGVYAAQGLRCRFRITPAARPAGLDRFLEARGYAREAETIVLSGALPGKSRGDAAEVGAAPGEAARAQYAELDEAFEWRMTERIEASDLEALQRLHGLDERAAAARAGILNRIVTRRCLIRASRGDRPIASVLGVMQERSLGVLLLRTTPELRGRGLARSACEALFERARACGAQSYYVQVERENAAALRFFQGFGGAELYRYWYRSL